MRVFNCDHCGHLVFFDSVQCLHCGSALAFLPDVLTIAALAPAPQDGADLSQMMRRADLRLSRAKLEGRNRVVVR